MKLYKKKSKKLIISLVLLTLATFACKTEKVTIVGVWKPKTLELSEYLKNNPNRADFVKLTFEHSKEIYYKFKTDGSFCFVSDKDIPGIQNAKGTYSIKGKTIVINYNNSAQENKIIKLTNDEFKMESKDSIIVVYEKIRND